MSSAFFPAQSYKPQVLSRQEGFHLPSPAPSNNPPSPPSSNGTPSSQSAHNSANNFDPHNLFMPPFLSVPDPFRKFPPAHDNNPSMDFSDELASLMASAPSPSHTSHERSTQSPANYDDYHPPPHNIFDISAPAAHHSPYGNPTGPAAAFSMPQSSLHHSQNHHTNGNTNGNGNLHPLHEFSTHFNSTVPAIGSSMRYEPPSAQHPFALNPSASSHGQEPSSFTSSHMSSLSNLSAFSSLTTTSDFHLSHHQPQQQQQRQTPSPVSAGPGNEFSRSRSRSRAPSATRTGTSAAGPPSTNGGPARRTRPKRNSVSSVSPPPLHRAHTHTQPLVIPGSAPRGPTSPLGLHGSGWFMGQGSEFSLPTPESVHGGFSAFTGTSVGSVPTLGVSPKDSLSGKGANGESPPDVAAKHRALLANEKRRRRRESHNAVERRRRDNINEKISELATLIPESLLDPNATLTMPTSLSASGEDLIFGGASVPSGVGATANAAAADKPSAKDGSAEPDDKDGAEGAVVKANKGMILRKSVEYIRYLQQLVSAQASRNRDLEQQLQAFRSGSGPSAGTAPAGAGGAEDDMGLLLHEEVDGFSLAFPPASGSGANANGMANGRTKKFAGFELESVEEMEMDTDLQEEGEDADMRPGTAARSETSPSAGSVDAEDEHEEEARGRRGRDGRPVGGAVKVKVKEEREDARAMETS
ncbi:HLH-domain-containing protein [Amylocystis lapponica]|nr:HLH-domain-containing protein [Amylocystis lapponica]